MLSIVTVVCDTSEKLGSRLSYSTPSLPYSASFSLHAAPRSVASDGTNLE